MAAKTAKERKVSRQQSLKWANRPIPKPKSQRQLAEFNLLNLKRARYFAAEKRQIETVHLDAAHQSCQLGLGDIVIPNLLHHGVLAPTLHDPLRLIFIVDSHWAEQGSLVKP
jgi:hypothetical protein